MTSRDPLSRRSMLLGSAATIAAAFTGTRLGTAGAANTPSRIDSAATVTKRARRLSLEPAPTTTTTTPTTTTTTAPATTGPTTTTVVGGITPNANGLVFPMGPDPVCNVLTNFGEARSSGRAHQGIDILATLGQNAIAVADGVITDKVLDGGTDSSLSGNLLELTMPDGTYYVYAHLSGFATGIELGKAVRQGDVIGYVGDTGNPGTGNYHLHFEVHPKGGAAIDPMKVLTVPTVCNVW